VHAVVVESLLASQTPITAREISTPTTKTANAEQHIEEEEESIIQENFPSDNSDKET